MRWSEIISQETALVYVILVLLGAVIGGPAGFLLVGTVFSLANPGKGCMAGLQVIGWLPFLLMGFLGGAAAGGYWASRLPDLFWAWQYNRQQRRQRRRED